MTLDRDAGLKPLAGLRVLDFTALPPGGCCTVMLADLGAEVIRVESPTLKGQPSLVIGQMALSRGKRSMTLDLREPESSEVLKRLAATTDVVVENARPGAMEARGFGYSHARAANRGLVWCAITGFGQDGPYAEHAGHDLSYVAHSGLLGALSAEQPWHPGLSLAIQAGALSAVVAIQAALLQRGRSGDGAFIDLSLSEAATWFLTCGVNPLSEHPFVLPASPDRRLYLCADGRFVAVASAEPRTWQTLCDQLGLPELKPNLHKAEPAEATAQALADVFRTRPAAEWVERLATAGAAVAIMNHGAELRADPHVQARGSVVEAGGVPVPASPLRIVAPDGGRTSTAMDAPHLVGQDTDDVLAAAGFAVEEIERLFAAGVI
jgi:crotonobetainyl-CoA:carnitine CoA-transferase CaiB-like acyl-CoA transferase